MSLIEVIKSANSNLLRNKGRSLLTILAIFIGTFTIIMTTGINTGVNGYIDKQMNSAGGEGYLEIMPEATMELMASASMLSSEAQEYNPDKNASDAQVISDDDIAEIKKVDGVKSAKKWHMTSAEYITSVKTDKKYVIELATMPTDTINVDMSAGAMVDIDAEKPQIALADKYVAPLGFDSDESAVGQTVKLAVKNVVTKEIVEIEAVISGVMNPSVIGFGRSWINDSLSQRLSESASEGLPAEYKDRAFLAVAQLEEDYYSKEKMQEIKDALKDMGYSAMTVEDEVGMIKSFFDAITIVLTIFGMIALVAASIGIINTLYMAVQERTREIGLMKAMGLGKGKIRTMFSFEAVALGFWGAVLGVAVAYAAKEVTNGLAAQTFLKDLPGFTLIAFNPLNLVYIVLLIMAIAFLAGTLPARKASKLDPIESLRYE
ncbi:ABC transporter permease [Candidatus Saccharibacteria bacterium]|nr:ABC transporter permease [Candidatus Saccharibacteria bacterium]